MASAVHRSLTSGTPSVAEPTVGSRARSALTRLVDAAFGGIILCFGAIVIIALIMGARITGRSAVRRRRVLHLVSGSIEASEKKDGLYFIREGRLSDLGGFFERIFVVYFLAGHYRHERLNDSHELIDFHVDSYAPLESIGLHWTRVTLNEIALLLRIRTLAREQGIGLIQAMDPYLNGLNALLLSRMCRVPYAVMVISDYDFMYEQTHRVAFQFLRYRNLEKLMEWIVLSRASLVITDREHYKQYAIRNGARPERARASRVTTHSRYYRRQPETSRNGDTKRTLLYVGRLSLEKYVSDLVRCLSVIDRARKDVHLMLVGDGPERKQLQELAHKLRLQDRVLFLGAQSPENLPEVYRQADIVLAPNSGVALLEAALCARAIVGYDYEWHPEIVRHGSTGLLVDFGDYKSMADAVLSLLNNPDRAEELGANARAFALEYFDQNRARELMRSFYAPLFSDVQ